MTEERYTHLRRYFSGGYQKQPAARGAPRARRRPTRSVRSGDIHPDPLHLSAGTLDGIAHELRALLGEQHSEEEWSEILREELGYGYDPRRDGMPVRDWLSGLLAYFEDRIRTEAWKARPDEPPEMRAARLRPYVTREVERIGHHELADRTDLPPAAILQLVQGGVPAPSDLDRFRYYDFGAFPDLSWLLGSCFGEDSSTSPTSWKQAVERYVSVETAGRVRGALADVDRVLSEKPGEEQLQRALEEMGCSFFPPSTGLTYRGWLEQVRDTLVSSSAPARNTKADPSEHENEGS